MNPRAPQWSFAAARRARGGFTLIELIVVIVLVSVVALLGAERLFYYQERAEKAAMDANLASFKMGLQIRSAELTISNQPGSIAALERENPVRWLDTPPSNYAGEYRSPPEPGHWYFVPDKAELVYVPNNAAHLKLSGGTAGELRFKIRFRYDDIDTADGKRRILAGVGVVPVTAYEWF